MSRQEMGEYMDSCKLYECKRELEKIWKGYNNQTMSINDFYKKKKLHFMRKRNLENRLFTINLIKKDL